jgi:hypothetical protein
MDLYKQKSVPENLTDTADPNVAGSRGNSGSESSITISDPSPRIDSTSSPNEPAYVLRVRSLEGRIMISIADDRLATSLGDKQGDHVSAYRLYLEILCQIGSCEDYTMIPKRIANIAKAIMPPKDHRRVDEKLKKFRADQSSLLPRESRKEMTAALSHLKEEIETVKEMISTLSDSDKDKKTRKAMLVILDIANQKDKAKHTLKQGEMSVTIEAIHELGQEFITALNESEEMTFAKSGGNKTKDSVDGPNVQKGLYGLQAMNVLLSLKDADKINDEDYINLLYDRLLESRSTLLQGLRQLDCDNSVLAKTKPTSMKKAGGSDITILEHEKKVEKGEDISLQEKQKLFEDLLRITDQDKIAEKIAELIGNLFDFPNKDGRKSELLEVVIARHLVIIFNAFPMLQTLDQNMQDNIIYSFIDNKILKDQKWEDYEFRDEITGEELKLTKEDIKKGIATNTTLTNGDFSMEYQDNLKIAVITK